MVTDGPCLPLLKAASGGGSHSDLEMRKNFQQRIFLWHGLIAQVCLGLGLLAFNSAIATAAPLELKDLEGQRQTPLVQKEKAATVLIFITTDCPVANKFAPEIKRIYEAYRERRVAFFLVQVDPDLSVAAARKHAQEYGYQCPVLLDRKHELVRQMHARVTPEAMVVSPAGEVLYRGRINDLQTDYGRKRGQPSVNDLRDALEAVLAGKPVPHPVTEAVGCIIPDLEPAKN